MNEMKLNSVYKMMEDKGFKDSDLELEDLLAYVRYNYGIIFDQNYAQPQHCYDFYVYEESTADGYSVWIATYDDRDLCINSDVFYYENKLDEAIVEAIYDIGRSDDDINFFISDMDSSWFAYALQTVYTKDYEKAWNEIMQELKIDEDERTKSTRVVFRYYL
jgi:hypothetical protein